MENTRKKISFTMSSRIFAEIDRNIAGTSTSRSRFIERVLRDYFGEKQRSELNARDAEFINANADYLNQETQDVLLYQAPIDFSSEEQ